MNTFLLLIRSLSGPSMTLSLMMISTNFLLQFASNFPSPDGTLNNDILWYFGPSWHWSAINWAIITWHFQTTWKTSTIAHEHTVMQLKICSFSCYIALHILFQLSTRSRWKHKLLITFLFILVFQNDACSSQSLCQIPAHAKSLEVLLEKSHLRMAKNPYINLHRGLRCHKNQEAAPHHTELESCSENIIICLSIKIPNEIYIAW